MVRLIYLPAGRGAKKQGVDDYLASGHTVDELLEHATPELKQPPDENRGVLPYRAAPTGLVWDKPTQNGTVSTPLTNFAASIIADVAEDDGAELRRYFEIEANLNGRRIVFSVPSFQFAGMGWATEHLEAGAIVYPGFGIKDHARAAVQMLSGEVSARHVYSHTGWRNIGDRWLYLHAGGAIGQEGQVGDVNVELIGGLERRTFPEPQGGEELVKCNARREWASLSTQHKRTPRIVADLALGLRHFLLFAHDSGALSGEEAERLLLRGWAALGEAAAAQAQLQVAGEPTRRFTELLSAAMVSGRAHVANPEGDQPEDPGAWGWRRATIGTGDHEREEWRPLGERVGWIEGDKLYLLPEAAYAAAQKQGRDSGEPLTVTERTLRKRLHERGLLLSAEESRRTLAVRRTLGGQRRGVLHLSADFLSLQADQADQGEEKPSEYASHAPSLWSSPSQQPDHEGDQIERRRQAGNSGIGQLGHVSDDNSEPRSNGRVNSPARERFTI